MTDENRAPGLVQLVKGVVDPRQGLSHPLHDDAHPALRMPEVGVLCDGLEFLLRPGGDEREARALRRLREDGARDQRHVVAAQPQLAADPDVGVHVAGRPDGGQNVVALCQARVRCPFDSPVTRSATSDLVADNVSERATFRNTRNRCLPGEPSV